MHNNGIFRREQCEKTVDFSDQINQIQEDTNKVIIKLNFKIISFNKLYILSYYRIMKNENNGKELMKNFDINWKNTLMNR